MSQTRHDGFFPGSCVIEAYGAGGFRFAEMSHRGSILALPSGVHAWEAETLQDITPASLRRLLDEPAGAIELLLIGTGRELVPPSQELRMALQALVVRLAADAHVLASPGHAQPFDKVLREDLPTGFFTTRTP